jgi:hypothetical protein
VVVLQEAGQSLLSAHSTIPGILVVQPLEKAEHFLYLDRFSLDFFTLDGFSLDGCAQRTPLSLSSGKTRRTESTSTSIHFYRSHPSLRECVRIRTPSWQLHWLHSPDLQHLRIHSHVDAEFKGFVLQSGQLRSLASARSVPACVQFSRRGHPGTNVALHRLTGAALRIRAMCSCRQAEPQRVYQPSPLSVAAISRNVLRRRRSS